MSRSLKRSLPLRSVDDPRNINHCLIVNGEIEQVDLSRSGGDYSLRSGAAMMGNTFVRLKP